MYSTVELQRRSSDLAIREADGADLPALVRLAELDSRRMPAGRVIVAKADGEIRAAIGLDDGTVVADPFAPTAALVDLLRLRVAQVRRESRRERRRRRLLGGLGLRLGGAGA